jgi:hypothetical protein
MKKIFSLIFISCFVLTSCEDELDINTNPNTPKEINSGLALTSAEGSVATVIGGDFFNLGGMLAQYYTQSPGAGQYQNIDQYNINTDFANRSWTELYAGGLNDLQFVQDLAIENEETGTYLIATVLKAYTFQYLVDVFGDVPYEEALLGNDNIQPSPTPGAEIYTDLIATVNDALAKYEANPVASDVGQQDLIYGANMAKWIQFANTLKLKMYIRMAYTSQADGPAVMALVSEDNFLTSDAKFSAYADALNKRNPFYDVQIDYLGDVNTVASNSLLEFYNRKNDPRIAEVYRVNNEDDFVGIDQGFGLDASLGGTLGADYSRPKIEATTPVYFMTVAESNFLQAEALLRYAGGSGVETKYNEGVAESFMLYGVPEDPNTFTGAGGEYEYSATGDVEADLEQIIVQKWAALANINNIEGWIETKRTGYPILTTLDIPPYQKGRRIVSFASVLPGDQIPFSIFYPDNEVTRNQNLIQKAGLTEKVWWNQR